MASLYYPRPGNGGITRDSNRDGEDGERPAFGGLSEVILYVEEMDRLVSFYGDVFGFDIVEGKPEHGFVQFDTGGCRLCLHAGGEGDRGTDAPKVVFAVDDVDAVRNYLRDHGVEVGEIRSPASGPRL